MNSRNQQWRFIGMVALLACWPFNSSFADQCQLLNKQQAELAKKYVDQAKEVWMYCLPCGETRPVRYKVKTSSLVTDTEGRYEIKLHGLEGPITPADLAYLFVPLKKQQRVYTNLAYLAGCPAIDTPQTIPMKTLYHSPLVP